MIETDFFVAYITTTWLTDWLLNCYWASSAQWFFVYFTVWRLWEPSEHSPAGLVTKNECADEDQRNLLDRPAIGRGWNSRSADYRWWGHTCEIPTLWRLQKIFNIWKYSSKLWACWIIQRLMLRWMMNCKGSERKLSWPNKNNIPAFVWIDWGKDEELQSG
jgi:hypothetical protein